MGKKLVILFLIGFLWVQLTANRMPIPTRIQVALFSKIFQYDSSLRSLSTIKLLIVYDSHSIRIKDDFVNTFQKASFEVGFTTEDKLKNVINNYDVVYFMPDTKANAALCRQYKKLSIAGISQYAESGEVTIGLGLVQDTPRVFVNVTTLEEEGHSLSPQILQIAKVYK